MELSEQEVFFRDGILLKKQAFSEEEAEVLKVEARSRKNQKGFIFSTDIRGDSSSWSYDAQQPPLMRCGIFFNNHRDYSYGAKFIKGSHRRSLILGICGFIPDEYKNARKLLGSTLSWNNLLPVNPFKMLNLPAEKGDLGIWSLRTVHSGYFRRLKTLPELVLPPMCENIFPDSQFPIPDLEKLTSLVLQYSRHLVLPALLQKIIFSKGKKCQP